MTSDFADCAIFLHNLAHFLPFIPLRTQLVHQVPATAFSHAPDSVAGTQFQEFNQWFLKTLSWVNSEKSKWRFITNRHLMFLTQQIINGLIVRFQIDRLTQNWPQQNPSSRAARKFRRILPAGCDSRCSTHAPTRRMSSMACRRRSAAWPRSTC